MHFLHRPFVALCVIASMLAGCATTRQPSHPATAPSTVREAEEIKSALNYLASDQLEGRGLETQGISKAADYIATQFQAAGLKPLPALKGYFQEFPITLSTSVGKKTALRINDRALKPETDFTPLGMSAEKSFSAPVAFVGYAIDNPEKNYDDFAGIDLQGKVALALRFEPTDENNKSKFTGGSYSTHAGFVTKAKAAADHGAVALLVVNPPKGPDQLMFISAGGTDKAPIPVIHISRDAAANLLQQVGPERGRDIDALRMEINNTLKPQSFDLPNIILSGTVEISHERKNFRNVIAYLPGTGKHKDEYIVVGAHYDHLGRGELGSLARGNRKEIHNGADDNASGTTAIIELGRELAHPSSPHKLDRSVIFTAFVGEERGLLGSMQFTSHPPVSLDRITAMVNLDMVGRVKNDVIFIGGNGTARDFDDLVKKADERSPLIVKNAGSDVGGRGGVGPSDHMSFAMKKIPVLFLWSGMHSDYHRPSDDADKINFFGVAEVVDLCADLVTELSKLPREEYVDKYDKHGGGMGGIKVRLGIMPDYNADPAIVGVRIAGTSPDSPASKAGLQEGDVILSIDADKIASLGDYMTALGKHKTGDVVKIIVDRQNKHVELTATLSEPQG